MFCVLILSSTDLTPPSFRTMPYSIIKLAVMLENNIIFLMLLKKIIMKDLREVMIYCAFLIHLQELDNSLSSDNKLEQNKKSTAAPLDSFSMKKIKSIDLFRFYCL